MSLRVAVDCTACSARAPASGVSPTRSSAGWPIAPRSTPPHAFAMTWRGRHGLSEAVPAGVRAVTAPMAEYAAVAAAVVARRPAGHRTVDRPYRCRARTQLRRPARRPRRRGGLGARPDRRAPARALHQGHARLPRADRRAVERGAWIQTVPAFVDEIIDVFGADPDRVVGIQNGVNAMVEGNAEDGFAGWPADAASCSVWARSSPARTSRGSSPPSISSPTTTPSYGS